MQIKTILFDVGGVLIRPLNQDEAQARADRFATLLGYEDREAMFHRFFDGPEWMATRIGEMTWAEMWRSILTGHGLPQVVAQEQFLAELFASDGVSSEMRALLEKLYGRYQLAILSNASDTLEGLLEKLDLARYFDPIINSHYIGVAKPDEEAYAIALNRLNVQPGQVYFIDDREVNTAPAEELGMRCHVFSNTERLRVELIDSGLL